MESQKLLLLSPQNPDSEAMMELMSALLSEQPKVCAPWWCEGAPGKPSSSPPSDGDVRAAELQHPGGISFVKEIGTSWIMNHSCAKVLLSFR